MKTNNPGTLGVTFFTKIINNFRIGIFTGLGTGGFVFLISIVAACSLCYAKSAD